MKWTSANVKNPNYTQNHEIYVGTHTGSLKKLRPGVDDNPFKQENLYDFGDLNKNSKITSLDFVNEECSEILIGRADNIAEIHPLHDNGAKRCIELISKPVVGLARYGDYLVCGFATGQLQKLSLNANTDSDAEQLPFNAGDDMSRMRHCTTNRKYIATGGKGRNNNLKVFDIETEKQIFNSKNLPNDYLQLEVPVWDSDIGFKDEHTLVTCSRYGYVRLYDIRQQRRPIRGYSAQDQMSFTTLIARDNYVYAGTTMGVLKAFDIRQMKNYIHTYKGFSGSITDLQLDVTGKYLASASLDRYARVHHADSCVLMYQCYVKSKATRILIRELEELPSIKTSKEKVKTNTKCTENEETCISEDEEYDNIFNNMQTVCENEDLTGQQPETCKRKNELKRNNNKKLKNK